MSSVVDTRTSDPIASADEWARRSECVLGHLARPRKESRATSIVFVAALTVAIGAADYASGIRIALAVFYLVPVFLATAWFGWQAGTTVACASVFLRIAGDWLAFGDEALPLWSLWTRSARCSCSSSSCGSAATC